MEILVAGDFCDKYRVKEAISKSDYTLMFEGIKNEVKSADLSIVNFEFPIGTKESSPIDKCGPNLIGQKKAINAIKFAGFKICTLANNHILDQGEKSCIETKRMLEDVDIKTVGVGSNISEASKILYVHVKENVVALINCCEREFSIASSRTAGANPLDPINQYYAIKEAKQNANYVVVIVHGGIEHFQLPSLRMKSTYRFFVDSGADVVINHHQHCYSGYEIYKGKPIFYGIGNFLFDRVNTRNSIWNEGYLVKLLFKDKDIDCQLLPYKQCNETASVNFMNEEEKNIFEKKINELNEIIKDDKLLEKNVLSFYDSNEVIYRMALEPYSNRFTRALWKRGLLPSFLTKERILLLQNLITCESHYERMVHLLKKI